MVLAVLLAAGGGTRFAGDGHKLRAPLRGRPVLAHALAAVRTSGLEAVVVAGAVDVGDLVPEGIEIVQNPRWGDGQATSVQAGIAEARRRGHDAVVVGLGDQPFVAAEAWRAVAAAEAPIAVATWDGRRGHPVRLAAEVWPLLPTAGDEVGRAVMRGRPDLVLEIPCAGGGLAAPTTDIDTVEDLRRWS
ncbi:MAG: NTP transferase domain-containing protein [Acidimicrobiia bacterium]